jgi:hypothetical protein
MELEFYDAEKQDYFLEEYRNFAQEPTEQEKEFFRPLLEEIVEEISDVTGISTDFKLYFAVTDEKKFDEDIPINFYVHGFSNPSWIEGASIDYIMARAVKDRENWRDCLVNMLAHEMAHQNFYSKIDEMPISNLETIIFEGNAMNLAEKVSEELGVEWKPHYRSGERIDVRAEKIIELLDEDFKQGSEGIFKRGEDPSPDAEGYNIAYQVVKDILGRTDLELEDLPEASDERLREEVEESLDRLLR